MAPKWSAIRNWAVLVPVAALAVAATVDGVRHDPDATPDVVETREADGDTSRGDEALVGPDSPLPGALPGRLVVTTADGCRLRVVDLASIELGTLGPTTTCAIWASPAGGRAAVVAAHSLADPDAGRFALVRLDDPPKVERRLGEIDGEPSWSPDGARLAWCTPEGETVVLDIADGGQERSAGCRPRFTPGGSVLTTSADRLNESLLRDGAVELDPLDLLRGFDASSSGDLDLLGYDEASDGLLAVSVLRLEPQGSRAVLELWQEGELVAGVDLPRNGSGPHHFGEYLQFSPNGTVLAIGAAPRGSGMTFVDLRLRRPSLDVDHQRAFAWSPDSAWLAVAGQDEIAVYSANGSEPVYRLPLRATAVAWVPDGKQGGEGG